MGSIQQDLEVSISHIVRLIPRTRDKDVIAKYTDCIKTLSFIKVELGKVEGSVVHRSPVEDTVKHQSHDTKLADAHKIKADTGKEGKKWASSSAKPETLDSRWLEHVKSSDSSSSELLKNVSWTDQDIKVLRNAVDKSDATYYSIAVLAKHLNRSVQSVKSMAITVIGVKTRGGFLVTKNKGAS